MMDFVLWVRFRARMVDTDDSCSIDWNSEDDREIDEGCLTSAARVIETETHPSDSSGSNIKRHFLQMGFLEEMVVKAIEDNGGGNADHEQVLDSLLTYSAIGNNNDHEASTSNERCGNYSPIHLSDDDEDSEMLGKQDHDGIVSVLVEMGFAEDEVLLAIARCGPNSPIDELADFIGAAQMVKVSDAISEVNNFSRRDNAVSQKIHLRKKSNMQTVKKQKLPVPKTERMNEFMALVRLPNPMIGYGLPGTSYACSSRNLPIAAKGLPYFYYENVALAPKGVWEEISSFLYEVQPEFVDSAYISAANRKRGYIHNLPIKNRFPLLPLPPTTIQEALPSTKNWWPSWDKRTKFNCLQTCIGSAKLTERILKELEKSGGAQPPLHVQRYVLEECRRWNLVWVGTNKVAPLEPTEMEFIQGYPEDHTRGVNRTDRYKALGNTFQIDTVAYHLSVLKEMHPSGMNVLSLFSGIGGAEIALHRLGIQLKNVVSVEISDINRQILHSWWEQTGQEGNLIEMEDVRQVTSYHLDKWSRDFGGFDLVIGGSPCNNLAGSNRHSRVGLEGSHSSLFYEYVRILNHVRSTSRLNQ